MDLRSRTTAAAGLLVGLALAAAARAEAPVAPAAPSAPGAPEARDAAGPTRAARLGLCFQYLVANPFAGKSSDGGPGLVGAYEFLVSPRFALGLELGYRAFFGDQPINQIVYGVVLKHYLTALEPRAPAPLLRPYLQYGLLQQITRQRGHSGAAVSYDAGLMAGADVTLGPAPLFAEAAFHFSHLSALDAAAQNASYLELTTGVRIAW